MHCGGEGTPVIDVSQLRLLQAAPSTLKNKLQVPPIQLQIVKTFQDFGGLNVASVVTTPLMIGHIT